MLWLTVHPSVLPPLGKRCVNHSQTTHAWHQDIVPGDDTKIQQNSGGRHVCVCSWVDDWVGWRVERVHCLKGNIRPKMKRGSWKWWVAPSAVTGVNSTVIVLAGRELPTQPPPPPHFAAWNWDRWLHSDRIIPNLVLIYTVHIMDFYNMTRKTSSRTDGLILGFHVSTGLGVVLIIPDRFYHLKATHVSKCDFITASPGDFSQTQRDELLLGITHRTDELWDVTVGDTFTLIDRKAILNDISLKYWWHQHILEEQCGIWAYYHCMTPG